MMQALAGDLAAGGGTRALASAGALTTHMALEPHLELWAGAPRKKTWVFVGGRVGESAGLRPGEHVILAHSGKHGRNV